MRIAILTVSDSTSRGERQDASGDAIAAWAVGRGDTVADRRVVPDETGPIASTLAEWADRDAADLILTTGGTGVAPRDVTPEATRAAIEREMPGLPEAIRMSAWPGFPRALLSRAVAGIRGRTLIVNLPGSPGGVRDGLAVLDPLAAHAVAVLRGESLDHR